MPEAVETIRGSFKAFEATGTTANIGPGDVHFVKELNRSFDVNITGSATLVLQGSNNPAAQAVPSAVVWHNLRSSSADDYFTTAESHTYLRFNLTAIATTGSNEAVAFIGS